MASYHSYLRAAFRREVFPDAALWLMATDATAVWLRTVAKALSKELGDREASRRILTAAVKPAFRRRYDVLAEAHAWLPSPERDPRAVARVMAGLYRTPSFRRISWVLDDVGGAPATVGDHLQAWRLVRRLSYEERWHESATHLGELLIVLTQQLPDLGLKRTNAFLGKLCFDAGARYATEMKQALKMADSPASAIELLRMGEYIFRVNPEHEHGSDPVTNTGFIEGNACPWYSRPGWGGAHCGIFGQFQNGISSAFGLRYRLTKTIPRHGGQLCRIELTPVRLRRSRTSTASIDAL